MVLGLEVAVRQSARDQHRVGVIAAALVSLLGFGVQLAAFWPGLMSVDSIVQYTQGIVLRRYGDQHPPIMAWLWGWTDRAVTGPGGMLVVHLAMFWVGLFAIAAGARRERLPFAWCIPFVGLLPTSASIIGVIWKDVGMACALLCATGLTFCSVNLPRASRVALRILALALLLYATMVRANAAAATVAIACYWIAISYPQLKRAHVIAGGIAIIALMLATQQAIERVGLGAARQYHSQLLLLHDLVGISCPGGNAHISEVYRAPAASAGALCDHYDPDQVDALFFFPDSPLRVSYDKTAFRELRATWLTTVVANPGSYLSHRARVFAGVLGLRATSDDNRLLRQRHMQSNPWGFSFDPNPLSRGYDSATDALGKVGGFAGLLWIGLALLLVIPCLRAPTRSSPELPLLLSAILYFVPYFFVSLAPNYRFIYWTVLATSVAGVLLAIRWLGHVAISRSSIAQP